MPRRLPLSLLSLLLLPLALWADRPIAFPGAEGHGRFATGGRGGELIAVTNLNDSGPGSLRAAVEAEGPRTVIFRVSGTIFLESNLEIKNGDITIAGQTAPGGGITLANYSFQVEGKNIIVRFIRSRLGDREDQQADAFEARYAENVIIDHCSFSWAVDETATAYNNRDFTMQWCILSEALHNSVHAKGNHGYGGIWGGKSATFHHNLLAHSRSRMPRFNGARYDDYAEWGDDQIDHRNNVIYNWGDNSAYGAEPHASGFRPRYNIVGNVYKPGPATQDSKRDRIIDPDTNGAGDYARFYVAGNYVFDADATSLDNWRGVDGVPAEQVAELRVDRPFGMGVYQPDWQLLRFDRDEDGDGALDIFEDYEALAIDPAFDTDTLGRFDVTGPELLVTALRGYDVERLEDLPVEVRELVLLWFGYYEAAGAVYADGTPFVAAEYERIARDSARADALQFAPIPAVVTFPALEAYEQVLAHAGASFPHRDSVDARVTEEVRTGTATYGNNGHIDSQNDVGGYPELPSTEPLADSDDDGMPDDWEIAHDLDPSDPEDRNGEAGGGYTHLEVYLNGLVAEHFRAAYAADYGDWASAAFWDGAASTGPEEDPDGDGLVNALEYLLIRDPRRAEDRVRSGPGAAHFTYRLDADWQLDVRAAEDLRDWSTAWTSADAATATVPLIRVPAMHHAAVTLDFAAGDPPAPATPLFWRLEAAAADFTD